MLALSVKLRKMFMDELWRSREESAKREQVLKDEAAAIDGRGYSSHFGKEATSAEATMTSTMIVIVAVSATFLVISVLSAGLLVVYCRRVKVRI